MVRTFGSAPRPEGAVLLVADDGRLIGSVSGGCVEGAAAEEIAAARRSGRERVIRYGISDEQAWDVGLACGGTIDVLIQPGVPPEPIAALRASIGPAGRPAAVVTRAPGGLAAGGIRAARARARGAPGPADRGGRGGQRRRRFDGRRGPPTWRSAPPRRGSSRTADPGPSRWADGPSSSRRSRFGRGSSSWAASRWRDPSFDTPASSATRRSSSTAGRPSRPPSGSRMSIASRSPGRTRPSRRSTSARTTPSRSCPTIRSSMSRRSSRPCDGAAGMSGRSGHARRRAIDACDSPRPA